MVHCHSELIFMRQRKQIMVPGGAVPLRWYSTRSKICWRPAHRRITDPGPPCSSGRAIWLFLDSFPWLHCPPPIVSNRIISSRYRLGNKTSKWVTVITRFGERGCGRRMEGPKVPIASKRAMSYEIEQQFEAPVFTVKSFVKPIRRGAWPWLPDCPSHLTP